MVGGFMSKDMSAALEKAHRVAKEKREKRLAEGLSANMSPDEKADAYPSSLKRAIVAMCY
jgi:hypothetical protein